MAKPKAKASKAAKPAKPEKAAKPAKATKPTKTAKPAKPKKTTGSPRLSDKIPKASRFELGVAAFFTAFIIPIVRFHVSQRPMDQFYWYSGSNDIADFFSYYKMVFIIISAVMVLLILAYRGLTGSFHIKKSRAYIFMGVYALLVILSYLFSDYKDFALLGFNDRYEGTLVLLSYMILVYFIFNIINSERELKWIVYALGGVSVPLGLLGLSQYLDHDFFRTTFGKKLIMPSAYWGSLDTLKFTFQNREIYQTVYNINYVSLYITLFIPLFGLLFLYKKTLKDKAIWGALFMLAIFNLVGSKSSGGFLGMGVVFILALILFRKQLFRWKIPLLLLLAGTLLAGYLTQDVWIKELTGAYKGVTGKDAPSDRPYVDYIITEADTTIMSLNGEPLHIQIHFDENGMAHHLTLADSRGENIDVEKRDEGGYSIMDDRFKDLAHMNYGLQDETLYVEINTKGNKWLFSAIGQEVYHINQLGKPVKLSPVEAWGFEDNQKFGTGRGYIWSRTLPMIKETVFIGHGADTYCIYFPHYDYAGKYNAKWQINKIVDKPHNMYLGMAVGTGLLSLLALLGLYFMYLAQSFILYIRSDFDNFSALAGAGIFLGISGFLVASLVNDSSVSVMPMFYGLLGTGLAVNRYLLAEKAKLAEQKK